MQKKKSGKRQANMRKIGQMIDQLEASGEEFTEDLWASMVERVTVNKDGMMVFTLASGADVQISSRSENR